MGNIEVPGANGTLETNWEGKAEAAVKALLEENYDFVYVHMEAPDEMGHQGSLERKIKEEYKFITFGGDGGTYDIGFQSLSGAMERGHDMVYVCYDNGAYMNLYSSFIFPFFLSA